VELELELELEWEWSGRELWRWRCGVIRLSLSLTLSHSLSLTLSLSLSLPLSLLSSSWTVNVICNMQMQADAGRCKQLTPWLAGFCALSTTSTSKTDSDLNPAKLRAALEQVT